MARKTKVVRNALALNFPTCSASFATHSAHPIVASARDISPLVALAYLHRDKCYLRVL